MAVLYWDKSRRARSILLADYVPIFWRYLNNVQGTQSERSFFFGCVGEQDRFNECAPN